MIRIDDPTVWEETAVTASGTKTYTYSILKDTGETLLAGCILSQFGTLNHTLIAHRV